MSNVDLSRHSVHWDSAAHASSGLETLDFPPRKKTWPPDGSRLVMVMVVVIMMLVQPGWMILIPFGNDSCITRDLLLSRFLAERAAYGMTKQVSWPLAFFLLVGKKNNPLLITSRDASSNGSIFTL